MAAGTYMAGRVGGSASSATGQLEQLAKQYYAAVAASAGQGVTTTTTSASSTPSSHKIHELQERALKSPVTNNRSTSSPGSLSLNQSLSRGATPTSLLTSISLLVEEPLQPP